MFSPLRMDNYVNRDWLNLILSSEYPPVNLGHTEFQSTWESFFIASPEVDLMVGYISTESLNYLDQLVDIHPGKRINLMVGMAMFDGVSRGQKTQLLAFSEKLQNLNAGDVFITQQFPFHGKVHVFGGEGTKTTAIVGSSNLSNILPHTGLARGNFEIDFLTDDEIAIANILGIKSKLLYEASSPIKNCEAAIPIHLIKAQALRNHSGAELIPDGELAKVLAARTGPVFDLPVSTQEKSSLNVYFGKGRATGPNVRPRNWYEAALIVSNKVIEGQPGYPKQQKFYVYTDDGFRFVMRASGGNSKNLESFGDLTTFGRWVKGRLEDADALQTGGKVTSGTLQSYGRLNMILAKTSLRELFEKTDELLDVWFLDFARP